MLYFHKPADALAVDAGPDQPAEATGVAPGLIPSVLPEDMPATDRRLALAPAERPASMPLRRLPASADVPVSTAADPVAAPPAGARADDPAPAAPPAGIPETTTRVQRKQDLGPPKTAMDTAAATRLPARDKIFVIYDDANLERAIITSIRDEVQRRQKLNDPGQKPMAVDDDKYYKFPDLARLVPPGTVYQAKTDKYDPRTELVEPAYVVHRRLYFEQKNVERGGWDLGLIQPAASAFHFYNNLLTWPHGLASNLRSCWDTSAGKCLPGNPTPFYLYPPEATLTGTVAEAVVVTGTAFILRP